MASTIGTEKIDTSDAGQRESTSRGQQDGRNRKRPRNGSDKRVALYGKRSNGPEQSIERKNQKFEDYYRKQGICSEDEFDSFLEVLRVPLGTAFRATSSMSVKHKIAEKIERDFSKAFDGIEIEDGFIVSPPKKLPWYPDGFAWTFNVPRPLMRKNEKVKVFHKFITAQNTIGSINRQEVVSMIPPLLLDLKHGQNVIDLCAAPGSKTAQILDALAAVEHGDEVSRPKNLIIANDSDLKRCNMLCHQLKRFNSPDLLVTNHDAQHFPGFTKFDRVLCDVPCSGDATLRKAPDMWIKWDIGQGNGLHRLQIAIGKRGLQLLKPGGRMVYSTCSFNPIENEAVVCQLLKAFDGEVELVDVSDQLPGLKRRNGLRKWFVRDPNSQQAWYSDYSEVPDNRRKSIHESMFPPSEESTISQQVQRCIRIVPQDQDTGGFFVAVLQKKSSEAEVDERQTRVSDEAETKAPAGGPRQKPDSRVRIGYSNLISSEPLGPIRETASEAAKEIDSFYGFEEKWVVDSIYSRNMEKQTKRFYYVPKHIGQILDNAVYAPAVPKKLRVLSAGVRAFEKCPRHGVTCSYRMVYDSLDILLPFVKSRILQVPLNQFLQLLVVSNALSAENMADEESKRATQEMDVGSIIYVLKESRDAVILWCGKNHYLSPLMPSEVVELLCLKYGVDPPPPKGEAKAERGAGNSEETQLAKMPEDEQLGEVTTEQEKSDKPEDDQVEK